TDGGSAVAPAAPTSTTISLTRIASVTDPVLAIGARDGTGRIFIVAKGGQVRVWKGGFLMTAPFLDIATQVSTGSEQGLLGLAFHPAFKTNRKFYVDFTDVNGTTVIREYKASATNPDLAVPGSGRTLLRIAQPYANHNGGMIAFGRDGYLYIGMGDGGSGGDPGNRAQSTSSLLGKMLRIDVNGTTATRAYRIPASNPYVGKAGLDQIWQRGLRNPWRFSFDRANGNLWIGDVGQGTWEEVDRAPRTAAGPGRGINWGWHVLEGRHCYLPATGCSTTGKQMPLAEYSHASNGRCAISGGYVYRGTVITALRGWYVYGDYCSGEVFAVSASAATPATATRLLGTGSGRMISGFGEDDAGELYLCDLASGSVFRIVAK
ncbi:MAG: PQQ-dependent sugar dehydrogenase, partial [Chloroflexota bacterium]